MISAVDLEKRIEDVTVCAVKRLQRIERGRTVDQDVELIDRSGPDHAAHFTVRVKVHNVGEVEARGSSKQQAETEAARAFMEKFG